MLYPMHPMLPCCTAMLCPGDLAGPVPAAVPPAAPAAAYQTAHPQSRDPFGAFGPDATHSQLTSMNAQQPLQYQQPYGVGGPTQLHGLGSGAAPAPVEASGPGGRAPLDDFFSTMSLSSGPVGVPQSSAPVSTAYLQQHQQQHQPHPSFPQQAQYQQGPAHGAVPGAALATNYVSPATYGSQASGGGGGSFLSPIGGGMWGGPGGVASGGGYTAPGPSAAAPSWSHAPLSQQATQPQLRPAKSINDNNAFDFVKDHLK